jgi:two-component system, LuxR family, sensor kinase FixL
MLDAIHSLRLTPRPWPPWLAGTVLFVGYVIIASAMRAYAVHYSDERLAIDLMPLPWVAEGFAVAVMLLGGVRLWPAVFLASCTVWGVIQGDPAITVLCDAIGETLSLVLVVHLLERWGFHRRFDRLRDPFVLIVAALLGRAVAADLDIAGVMIAVWFDRAHFPVYYLNLVTSPGVDHPTIGPKLIFAVTRWELNAVAGIVLAAPAFVASARPLRHAAREHPWAVVAWGALAMLWCSLTLSSPYEWSCWILLLAALALVAWAAIEFGVLAASLATLVLSGVAAASVCQGIGPLNVAGLRDRLGMVWAFIGLLALTSPILAVVLAQRRRELRRLTVLAERNRMLFRVNPSPAWVVEPGSGQILLANDEALRRYGYAEAEMLAMTLGDLLATPKRDAAVELPSGADLIASAPLRHRTRDGSALEVELFSTALEFDGRMVQLCYAVDMTDRYGLRRRLLATADRERRRLAQELHDGLGQALTGLSMGVQSALARARRGATIDAAGARFLQETAAQAETQLNDLTAGVSPLEALRGDLLEALRRLPESLPPTERDRLKVVIAANAPLAISLERREHLYRVAQEAVANSIKHARARQIVVRASIDGDAVRVSVEDDGVGIDRSRGQRPGLGLRSMQLRAQAMGGALELHAREGGGTRVECNCSQSGVAQADARPAPRPAPVPTQRVKPLRSIANWSDAAKALLIAAACCAGTAVSTAIVAVQDPRLGLAGARLALPALSAGAAAAGLIVGGRRLWPGVALGMCLSYGLIVHAPWGFAVIAGLIAALCSYSIATLLLRWRFTLRFERWQDPLLLLVAAALSWAWSETVAVAMLIAYAWALPGEIPPAISSLFTAADGTVHLTSGLVVAALRWTADGAAGVVLTVPAVVASPLLWQVVRGQLTETMVWMLAVCAWIVALLTIPYSWALMPLLATGIMLLLWAATRFGVTVSSLATLLCAMAAAVGFALQRGALAMADPRQGVGYLWGFLAVLTSISFFTTAALGERDRRRREIIAAGMRYRRLFEDDPRSLWVHDATSGRILAANHQAERTYGFSATDFASLRVHDLFETSSDVARITPSAGESVAPVELRQRTKSGRPIDADVSSVSTFVDGRRAIVCFSRDVSERTELRRTLLETTDLERRRLAAQLRAALSAPLHALCLHTEQLEFALATGGPALATLEAMSEETQRAVTACRSFAHRVSPLAANRGDIVAAVRALDSGRADGAAVPVRFAVDAAVRARPTDEQVEHFYELVREVVNAGRADGRAIEIVTVDQTDTHFSVRIDTGVPKTPSQEPHPLGRNAAVRLRAMAMAARLWEERRGDGGSAVICECAIEPVAA